MPPNTDFGEPSMAAGAGGSQGEQKQAGYPPTPQGEREEAPPKLWEETLCFQLCGSTPTRQPREWEGKERALGSSL